MKYIFLFFITNLALATVEPANQKQPLTNDSYFNYQWALQNDGQIVTRDIDDIHLEKIIKPVGENSDLVCDLNYSENFITQLESQLKKEVVIAVIDSGVNLSHPEITNQIFKNEVECVDGEIPIGQNIEDKDGNGYKGDCKGWNFSSKQDNDARFPNDDVGHGTHVSGIIAALKNNNEGISGVSNKIKILPLKVYGTEGFKDLTQISERITKAVHYAISRKVDVINFSLGWPVSQDTQELRDAIKKATQSGIVVVAAAGNNNNDTPNYPCAYEDVICVGSIRNDGLMSSFSNFGSHVDVLAPGDNILSLFPLSKQPAFFGVKGFEVLAGTSQATPFVSAFVALLKGVSPQLNDKEVKSLLYHYAQTEFKNKKTLLGPIQFKALKNINQTLVVPQFKNISRVVLKQSDEYATVNLPFVNYGDIGVAQIQVLNKNLILKFNKLESKLVEIKIPRTELEKESEVDLKVIVNGTSFNHHIVFSRSLNKDSDFLNYPIKEIDPKNISKLQIVKSIFRNSETELFYTESTPDGLKLFVYTKYQNEYIKKAELLLPKISTLRSLFKMDANYDGIEDYWLRGLKLPENKGDDSEILYFYFDKNLNPLFPQISSFKKNYENATLLEGNISSMRFLPFDIEGVGQVAMPVFFDVTTIPRKDVNPDYFSFEKNTTELRIYYFEPLKIENQVELVTRTYQNYYFLKNLKNKFQLSANIKTEINYLFPQSEKDFYDFKVKALLGVGNGDLFNYSILEINNVNLTERSLNLSNTNYNSEQFKGTSLIPVIDLSSHIPLLNQSAAFLSFYTNYLGRISFLNNQNYNQLENSLKIYGNDLHDYMYGVLASFKTKTNSFTFIEAQNNIILQTNTSQFKRGINRTTVVPGKLFRENFFPVMLKSNENFEPALFVNASQILSNHVYVVKPEGDRLSVPLKYNIDLPAGCRSLNTIYLKDSQGLLFVCEDMSVKILELN